MRVSNVTAWINEDTRMEAASVTMAFRIGSFTFFCEESENGLEKLQEIIDVVTAVKMAGYGAVSTDPVEAFTDELNRAIEDKEAEDMDKALDEFEKDSAVAKSTIEESK